MLVVAFFAVGFTKTCDGALENAAMCSSGGGELYAWLVGAAAVAVTLGAAIAVIASRTRRRWYRLVGTAVMAAAVLAGWT